MLQREHVGDRCVLTSTLCKYDLRKGDLFVLSWPRVRLVRRQSFRAANVRWRCAQYYLQPLVVRYPETIDVSIWCMFVLCLL